MGPCWAPGLSGFEMGGASPLCEGPAGEDDKDVCKWQWLPLSSIAFMESFFHLTFLSIIELSEFLQD